MKLLDRLYRKSEVTFAVVWIVIYVVLSSAADSASQSIGLEKCVTLPVQIILIAILWAWIKHAKLQREFGLCAPVQPATRMLLYVPLIIIATRKLWFSVATPLPPLETVLFIASMCCVGFLEELIFRGLLLRGMAKSNLTAAIIVSSLTFGLGHIVNLFNASGQNLTQTCVQIVFAIIVGFVLTFVLLRSGSLWPCIAFHAVNNALSAFEDEAAQIAVFGSEMGVILCVLAVSIIVGGGYLMYLVRMKP